MKKTLIGLVLLSMLTLTFSCKKDDSGSSSTPGFSMKVDGTLWKATNSLAMHDASTNYTSIQGWTSTTEQVGIAFFGSGTGTYSFTNNNVASGAIGANSFTTLYPDNPVGQLVVTKYDASGKKISGTFYFTAEDIDGNSFNITEGKFENVQLMIQ